MRIVSIITASRVSGAEKYFVSLTKELLCMGHNITVISDRTDSFINYMKKELKGFRCGGIGSGSIRVEVLGLGGKANYFAYRRLKGIIRYIGPDIIHTHLSTASFFGGKIGNVLGIPVVVTAHAIGDKWYYTYADMVICVSSAVYNYLLGRGISGEKLVIINNGIVLDVFAGGVCSRGSWGIPADNIVIACIAHFSRKKGHKILFRAFSRLGFSNKTLFLCGEGVLEGGLRKEADRLGIGASTIFAGFYDPIERLLPIFDIVVLPSLSGEGLPLSILESMSHGIPVVVSAISGLCDLVDDGRSGYLFVPGSEGSLLEKLSLLSGDSVLRGAMGLEGKRRVSSYSIRDNAFSVYNLYKSLLGGCV